MYCWVGVSSVNSVKKKKKCLYRTSRDNNKGRIRVFHDGGSKFDSRKRFDDRKKRRFQKRGSKPGVVASRRL